MTSIKNNVLKTAIGLLIFASLILRIVSIPHSNQDMAVYNLLWYQTLYQKGIGAALATNFANYTPPYTYLLSLATLTHNFIPPLVAIKLIPICFDLLGAFFIYKIVRLKYRQGTLPYLAAAIYLTVPTVILNSAYWGQADSLYTSFLLACLYFLLTEKSLISILTFGLAFSIKAQAVFLLPFLGVMTIRKRIPPLYFGFIPLVYLFTISPVVLLGRPFFEALLIYAKQSDTFATLSMNTPNLYSLFPGIWYSTILPIGLVVTVILMGWWIYATSQNKIVLDNKYIILIAFISTALTPFLLPKMHDRYFYPADALSIVLAFYWPTLWFIPVLYQLISTSAISVFLFNADSSFVILGFVVNVIALGVALRTQRLAEARDASGQKISSALSWLTAAFTSFTLFGISLSLLLTPAFTRIAYAMPNVPVDQYGFNKSERFQLASQTINYLINDKQTRYLTRLEFENGVPIFSNNEIALMDDIKKIVQQTLGIWRLSLAIMLILGTLAWAGNRTSKFLYGIKLGGRLTSILAIALGVAVIISGRPNTTNYFQSTGTVMRLFPIQFWSNFFLFMIISLIGSGLLLAISLTKIKNIPQD